MFISLSKPHAVYGAADNTKSSEITLLESDLFYQTLFFRYNALINTLKLIINFCREIQITLGSRLREFIFLQCIFSLKSHFIFARLSIY